MAPQARKALGAIAILAYLTAYIAIAAMAGEQALKLGAWAGLGFYAIAGIAWVLPLRPLMRWMNGGAP
jgi:hypothetical protein